MPPVRRFVGALGTALVAVCVVAVPPAATAQNANVTLRLVSQSPWTWGSADRPGKLKLELAASNAGQSSLADLGLFVSFGSRIQTQADFDAMLTTGVNAVAPVSKAIHGTIAAGARPPRRGHGGPQSIDARDPL